MQGLSAEELNEVIDAAVDRGVHKTLESLGFDMSKPLDIQRNMLYLDDQRRASEQVSTWTRRIIWTAIITGIISVLGVGVVQGLKQAIGILP